VDRWWACGDETYADVWWRGGL